MRRIRRRLLVTLLVTLVGVTVVNPAWASTLGCDVWNLTELHEQLEENQRRGRQLDEVLDLTTRQMNLNEAVIQELAESRRSLKETAKLMVVMNSSRTDYMTGVMMLGKGTTVEARMAENLIRLTSLLLDDERAPVVERLKQEYVEEYRTVPH